MAVQLKRARNDCGFMNSSPLRAHPRKHLRPSRKARRIRSPLIDQTHRNVNLGEAENRCQKHASGPKLLLPTDGKKRSGVMVSEVRGVSDLMSSTPKVVTSLQLLRNWLGTLQDVTS